MQIREQVLQGKEIHFSKPTNIPSEWVAEAVKKKVKVFISNAVLVGFLELKNTIVEEEFALLNCIIKGGVDFTYTSFRRRLTLTGTQFEEEVSFDRATADAIVHLNKTTFRKSVHFKHALFNDAFVGTEMQTGPEAPINFSAATFGKLLHLNGCIFKSAVEFIEVKSAGVTLFSDSIFEKEVAFAQTKFGGPAVFLRFFDIFSG